MKYVCTKSGEYLVLDTHTGLADYPLTSIYLSENKIYDIIKLIEPRYFNNTAFYYKLTIDEHKYYYIDEHSVNTCFRSPTITHYETKYFSDVGEMNNFLKTIPCDRFKDIKIQNKDYLVIYQVDGEV